MKVALTLLTAALLAGCGTINTVLLDDAFTSRRLAAYQSSCDSIPRVYSGVVFDFCSLTGGPHKHLGPGVHSGAFGDPISVLVDMAFSSVADTIVLPYTIYAQFNKGSIPKSRID